MLLAQKPPALEELRVILADIGQDDERAGEVIRRILAAHQGQLSAENHAGVCP